MRRYGLLLAVSLAMTCAAEADEVGRIGLDLKGNDVVVEAFDDPKVQGVTCHVSRFDRGTIDRLMHGNWFEDPSNMAIACRQTGPITIGDITLEPEGERVFSERASLIFKRLQVRRIYDAERHTLIYVAYSTEVVDASAKNSISTISLYNLGVAPPQPDD